MKLSIQKNKGFSIVELIVAAAMFAFVTLGSVSILQLVTKEGKNIEKKADKKITEEWLNKFLYTSLENIAVSYGILNVKDDNNKNFFDVLPDYHSFSLTHKNRIFTLENNKKFLFLSIKNVKRVNIMEFFNYYYDDLINTVTPNDAYFNDCYLRQELNYLWKNNGLVLLYIPAFLRNARPLNMNDFPRKPAFLGYMGTKNHTSSCPKVRHHSDTPSVTKYTRMGSHFNFLNPAVGGTSYGNIKDFVLNSHLIGGQDVVLAGIIHISIYSMKDNDIYHCIVKDKNTSLNCDQSNGFLFANNMKHMKFKRTDVTNTQIKISFEFLP